MVDLKWFGVGLGVSKWKIRDDHVMTSANLAGCLETAKTSTYYKRSGIWCTRRDSNARPLPSEGVFSPFSAYSPT